MKKFYYYFLILGIFWSPLYAQEKKMERAAEAIANNSYAEAKEILWPMTKKGRQSAELYAQLADSYYAMGELPKAAFWYQKQFFQEDEPEAEAYFRYAHSLKSIGNTTKADSLMNIFARKARGQKRAALIESRFAGKAAEGTTSYEVKIMPFNSERSDYAPAFYQEKLVFASARDTGNFYKRIHKWDHEFFTDFYSTDPESHSSEPEKIPELNSNFHESTAVFTKDGKTVYFTRNNYERGRKRDAKGVTRLKIYRAELDSHGKWQNIEALPFNSSSYSVAHPALNAEEDQLFFASDMPGGKGQSDLYVVAIHPDGSFGSVKNLAHLNTEARETFPFMSTSGILYFASDGYPGYGGLDIFKATPELESSVENLGKPVNSKFDDFSLILDPSGETGYFASNRPGTGSDDIYSFRKLEKSPNCERHQDEME